VCKVASAPFGDVTALDPKNEHFDQKATKENPTEKQGTTYAVCD
jgi:predicted RNA-binding protein with PUA-like domain